MGGAVVQLLAGGCVALQKEGCGFDSFIQGLSVWRFHILCLSEWLLCRPYFLFSDFSEPHLHHKTTATLSGVEGQTVGWVSCKKQNTFIYFFFLKASRDKHVMWPSWLSWRLSHCSLIQSLPSVTGQWMNPKSYYLSVSTWHKLLIYSSGAFTCKASLQLLFFSAQPSPSKKKFYLISYSLEAMLIQTVSWFPEHFHIIIPSGRKGQEKKPFQIEWKLINAWNIQIQS